MTLSKQKIFTRVATHLLTQGQRSRLRRPDGNNVCVYRGEEGTSCAVGCLIPDELYTPSIEGQGVSSLTLREMLVHSGVLTPTEAKKNSIPYKKKRPAHHKMALLASLQALHDSCPIPGWHDRLVFLAKSFGLTFPVALTPPPVKQ